MALSNYLAVIWGVSIVAVSLALLIKERHLKRLFSSLETEDNFFLWGMISFIAGIAMVLSHNIWVKNWQIAITILGWLALLKGAVLLFIPELIKKHVKKIEDARMLPFALLIFLFFGLALTYLGFVA